MDRVCSADTRRVIIATEQTLKRGARRKISETTGMQKTQATNSLQNKCLEQSLTLASL